jgi:hypothetical protein
LDLKEDEMFIVIKWISATLFAGFAWLVTGCTMEYLRPYKRAYIRVRNRE